MLVLDSDHVSFLILEESSTTERLRLRLSQATEPVVTTIITFEEQSRGRLAFVARAKSVAEQIEAYDRLKRHLEYFCSIPILPFDEQAAVEFQRLKQSRIRVGTMDLKIAAITLADGATLLSRNLVDFRRVPGLKVEDWTA